VTVTLLRGHETRTGLGVRGVFVLLALLGCLLALSPAAARASGPISWGQPTWADRATPFADTTSLQAVSCAPNTTLCVAVEQDRGGVWASTTPTDASSWTPTGVYGMNLDNGGGVSCPSTSLCVIVSQDSVFTSTTPTVPGSWKAAQIDSDPNYGGLTDVSCPSASLCVAVDADGNIFHSTNPAGSASAWSGPVAAGLKGGSEHISCPSATFCVEAGHPNGLKISNDPTGDASNWTDATDTWDSSAISCPMSSLCVTVDAESSATVHTTADPADSTPTWTSYVLAGQARSLSCSSDASVCAIGGYGQIFVSTNPTATSAGSWTSTTNLTGTYISGMACPSSTLCLGVSHDGNAYSSTTPGSATSWTQATVDESNAFTALSCPSAGLCVGTDDSGNVLSSTHPGDGTLWTVKNLFTPQGEGPPLAGLSCAGSALCAATDGTNIWVSTDPGGGSPTWSETPNVDPDGRLTDISCPSAQFCAAVGVSTLYISTDPSDVPSTWTATNFSGPHDFLAISCPTAQLCVWTDTQNDTIYLQTTSAGGTSVKQMHFAHVAFDDVSCSSASLCAAVATYGQVAVSTQPTGGASAWKVHQVEVPLTAGTGLLTTISCASHLCAAIDGNGFVYSTADVTSATLPWTTVALDPLSFDERGIACPPASYVCYVVNGIGQVRVGQVAKETLAVHRSGDGSGKVTGQQIVCPTTCSAGYPAGTVVTLKAHPAKGSLFRGWSGVCSGKGACTVTMAGAKKAVARFVIPAPHGTKITSSNIHGRSATFSFTALGKVAGFKCALQKGSGKARYSKCSSPKGYRQLAPGKYTFLVKAYNATGADAHPASKSFTIS
jgi:hypothetical protein